MGARQERHHRTNIHGVAIHDHCIKGCLALFVRRATPTHAAIASLTLAFAAALNVELEGHVPQLVLSIILHLLDGIDVRCS